MIFSFLRKIDFQDAAPGETGRLSSSPRLTFLLSQVWLYLHTNNKRRRIKEDIHYLLFNRRKN
jgi:hypothetical protein|nr:MAG TPA: hypothetical protein [Caudoviricetes sp.]